MRNFTFEKSVFIVACACFPLGLLAQFSGGIGDGNVVSFSSAQPLGRNIFVGGTNDGNSFSLTGLQSLGRNIFVGGSGDGMAVSLSGSQPLGRNIFIGGINDGTVLSPSSSQPLGRNIFIGGSGDGFVTAISTAQSLGRNIFIGGANDGWAMAFAADVVLPVTLVGFNGQWQANNALLAWKTATELNTSHFELERSFDGIDFTVIQSVNAAGSSSTTRNYNYVDKDIKSLLPTNTTAVYYRLKSVDKDGKSGYSGIVVLNVDRSGTIQYAVYPNPAQDYVMVALNQGTPSGNTYIRLADASGKVVALEKMVSAQQRLTLSSFATGTYYLQLIGSEKIIYTQKLIINKK